MQLRCNTHQEEPWMDHCCEGIHDNEVITHEELEKFFTKEISVNEQDNEFARIMDASEYTEDELLIMPSTITTAEQFNEWVESFKMEQHGFAFTKRTQEQLKNIPAPARDQLFNNFIKPLLNGYLPEELRGKV
ncbi:hypothetical protein P4S73_04860 [Paraglaciecola sp. Hal342]